MANVSVVDISYDTTSYYSGNTTLNYTYTDSYTKSVSYNYSQLDCDRTLITDASTGVQTYSVVVSCDTTTNGIKDTIKITAYYDYNDNSVITEITKNQSIIINCKFTPTDDTTDNIFADYFNAGASGNLQFVNDTSNKTTNSTFGYELTQECGTNTCTLTPTKSDSASTSSLDYCGKVLSQAYPASLVSTSNEVDYYTLVDSIGIFSASINY